MGRSRAMRLSISMGEIQGDSTHRREELYMAVIISKITIDPCTRAERLQPIEKGYGKKKTRQQGEIRVVGYSAKTRQRRAGE